MTLGPLRGTERFTETRQVQADKLDRGHLKKTSIAARELVPTTAARGGATCRRRRAGAGPSMLRRVNGSSKGLSLDVRAGDERGPPATMPLPRPCIRRLTPSGALRCPRRSASAIQSHILPIGRQSPLRHGCWRATLTAGPPLAIPHRRTTAARPVGGCPTPWGPTRDRSNHSE